MAEHGAACEGPPSTHRITTAAQSVFLCNNHLMTTQNGESACCGGYGMTYLTPPAMLNFAGASASLTYTVSTLRTSLSDWQEIWVSPFADQLADPIEPGSNPTGPPLDQQGPPKNGIEVFMDHTDVGLTVFNVIVYRDYQPTEYSSNAPGYESFLSPSAAARQTFELDVSTTHLRFGMPAFNVWWVDTAIPALGWTAGIVQIGHHSYTPVKDCGFPAPAGMACKPDTWHWGGVAMSSAIPFGIRHPLQSGIGSGTPATLTLPSPAPAGSYLRFEALGIIRYSLDGGRTWNAAVRAGQNFNIDDRFVNYWTPIPAGTATVTFSGTDLVSGSAWWVDGVSVFSLTP